MSMKTVFGSLLLDLVSGCHGYDRVGERVRRALSRSAFDRE
jgi:hypothetical protein